MEGMITCPREANILEWHYVIFGPKGSPYEGGYYHGIVRFPPDYPFRPPSIQMQTPNGRFKTNTRLCLSMSDFHPESWNPLWSVSTILMGLHSFMLEETPTQGSMVTTSEMKRKLAMESLEYNIKSSMFCEQFPELVEHHKKLKRLAEEQAQAAREAAQAAGGSVAQGVATATGTAGGLFDQQKNFLDQDSSTESQLASWVQIAVMVAILGVLLFVMVQVATL